jgi:hypothetical protein
MMMMNVALQFKSDDIDDDDVDNILILHVCVLSASIVSRQLYR